VVVVIPETAFSLCIVVAPFFSLCLINKGLTRLRDCSANRGVCKSRWQQQTERERERDNCSSCLLTTSWCANST